METAFAFPVQMTKYCRIKSRMHFHKTFFILVLIQLHDRGMTGVETVGISDSRGVLYCSTSDKFGFWNCTHFRLCPYRTQVFIDTMWNSCTLLRDPLHCETFLLLSKLRVSMARCRAKWRSVGTLKRYNALAEGFQSQLLP